jgi:PAS domain S-box-containing protein
MSEFPNSASEALGRTGNGSKPTYDELLARVAQLEQELHASFPAESVQRTTLQRFYSVLSSMYSGVLLVTDDGRVEFVNPAFCERFGLKDAPADLIGLGSGEMIEKIKNAYVHPDEAVTRIREILDRGQPVRGEEIEMRDGGTCLRDFVPLRVDGKSYGRLWIHFDISERKQAEAALRQSETR